MKKILVPTDFSKQSDYALDVAVFIAKQKNAHIKLLHVIEEPYTPKFSATGDMIFEDDMQKVYILKLMERTSTQLHKIQKTVEAKGISCEMEVAVDKAYSGIINDIVHEECDLVVIGSKGMGDDLDDFLIGSTAEKVIRKSKAPVLTVKSKPGRFNIKNIVFAGDFEEDTPKIIHRVSKFAEIFNAKLHLLRVNTPGRFLSSSMSRGKINELIEKYNLNENYTVNVYADKTEEEGILNFSAETKADLIVLGTHGRTGFSQLFKSSIAEDVAGHSSIPVLTYNIRFEEVEREEAPAEKKKPAKKQPLAKKPQVAKSAEGKKSVERKTIKKPKSPSVKASRKKES